MDLGLSGRVAIVTGAARGIGAATALSLAREGCDLCLVDLPDNGALGDVSHRVRALDRRVVVVEGDVRDAATAAEAVRRVEEMSGGLDIAVCNAGITRDTVIWKMDEEAWDEVIAVNLRGCFTFARAAALQFRHRDWGRIVGIASINGLRGRFGQTNYAASKAGLVGLFKSLARELGRFGVTANVVAPGMVRTDMAQQLSDDRLQAAVDEGVVGRLAEPDDVADAVTFLCSDRARHITGAVVKVDGGQYI